MQVGEKRAERVQPHAPLQAKGIERGNNQARLPPVALCSCPQPGLRMDVPMPHSLLETMCPALGHSRVLSTVAHTLRACLTKRVENPNTFLPKSHVGPVLQRGTELSPAFSSSKYMTDTQLSRLRPLPEHPNSNVTQDDTNPVFHTCSKLSPVYRSLHKSTEVKMHR